MLIYQPGPCRFRLRNGHRVGTVPVGTIVWPNPVYPLHGFRRGTPNTRNPHIVMAYQPVASSYDGLVRTTYAATFVCRSLRDGSTLYMTEWAMLAHDDAGLTR